MGDWLWILVLIFFLFRLLTKAGKKAGKAPPPGIKPAGRKPKPQESGLEELQQFLEKISGRPSPRPVIPPPPRIPPPLTRTERKVLSHPRKISTKPPAREKVSAQVKLPPITKAFPQKEKLRRRLTFSDNPVLQGIIFAEIIGPPKSERRGTGLPGDYSV